MLKAMLPSEPLSARLLFAKVLLCFLIHKPNMIPTDNAYNSLPESLLMVCEGVCLNMTIN